MEETTYILSTNTLSAKMKPTRQGQGRHPVFNIMYVVEFRLKNP